MLVRIVQFLFGALLAAGGGYLGWMHRGELGSLFPPGPAGPPWLLIAGVLGLSAGIVFLVSAVHPRPNRRREIEARNAKRSARMGEAEAYYAEAGRAADRDWRSGEISPPATPQPAPEAPPVQAAPLPQAVPQSVPPPVQPVAAPQPAAPPEPVEAPVFPSAASLSPIPVAAEAPPAAPAAPAPAPAAVIADANAPIRAAIEAGRLDEANKLLEAGRETAQGVALAELTGLAGDHAAASGRQSHAKWLWRLAMKRFGEARAMDTPAAKAVAESLRVNG